MNLRFVEAFVWVSRLGSFKGAAERLFTTQAAISNRIATLEAEIGIRLFERDTRSVEVTRQGRALLPVAEQLLSLADQFRSMARVSDRSEVTSVLRIGVIDSVAHTWLPDLLSAFALVYPKATVELYSDITPRLCEELTRGRIDCAIVSEEVIEIDIASRVLAEYPVVWVAAPGSPFADAAAVPIEELARTPIITFHRASVLYKDIVKRLPPGSRPKINSFSSISSMISLVKAGLGVAALPLPVVDADLRAGALRRLDVDPSPRPLPIVVNIRVERSSPMLEDFKGTAMQVCEAWMRRFGG